MGLDDDDDDDDHHHHLITSIINFVCENASRVDEQLKGILGKSQYWLEIEPSAQFPSKNKTLVIPAKYYEETLSKFFDPFLENTHAED